jgi:hypothetical protein
MIGRGDPQLLGTWLPIITNSRYSRRRLLKMHGNCLPRYLRGGA